MKYIAMFIASLTLALSGNSALAQKTDPGEPMLGSFIEDMVHAKQRLAQRSNLVSIVCEQDPCTLRDDFNGDGKRDLAFQFVRNATPNPTLASGASTSPVGTPGFAIALTDGGLYLFGAGLDQSGVDSSIIHMRSLSETWGCVAPGGLMAPPAMPANGVFIGGTLVHWNNTTFVVQHGLQRSS